MMKRRYNKGIKRGGQDPLDRGLNILTQSTLEDRRTPKEVRLSFFI